MSGTFTQILYSPVGKTATMSGQSTTNAYFPLPAGETLFETGSTGGNRFFWHKDWLGTVRFESNMGTRASANDRAFAPFGEMYNNFGTTGNLSFTGDTQDTIAGMFDTPNRELHPNQGRWISPDPGGLRAVDWTNPQTWNRYSYVGNNPLSLIDPTGTVDIIPGMLYAMTGGSSYSQWAATFVANQVGSGAATSCPQCDPGSPNGVKQIGVDNLLYGMVYKDLNGDGGYWTYGATGVLSGGTSPGEACQWGLQWVCDWVFQPQVYRKNKSDDQRVYDVSSKIGYDVFALAFSNAGPLWLEISQLESYNLMIDAVALGETALSTLDSIPGLDLSPPGPYDAADHGIDYFESVRDQNNVKINGLVEQIYQVTP